MGVFVLHSLILLVLPQPRVAHARVEAQERASQRTQRPGGAGKRCTIGRCVYRPGSSGWHAVASEEMGRTE